MFSFILQIFVESLLYAATGVGRKNLVVNETELVSAFVELIGKWRGHDSQLTTEIMFNYFVRGMRRKTQDTMTGRTMCYGYSEKDSPRTYHAGLALRQTDRTTITRPILVPVSFPFRLLLLPFSSLGRTASSLHKQHKVS